MGKRMLWLMLAAGLSSCHKKDVPLGSFSSIIVDGSVNASIASGPANSLVSTSGITVTAAVEGSVLILTGTGSATVAISNADSIVCNGNAKLANAGTITMGGTRIVCNGNNSFTLNNLNLKDSLSAVINGSGNYAFSGIANRLIVRNNGAGQFSGYTLTATTGNVSINNTGSIQVYVNAFLSGIINGDGNVYYKGNAIAIPTHKSGTGQFIKQ